MMATGAKTSRPPRNPRTANGDQPRLVLAQSNDTGASGTSLATRRPTTNAPAEREANISETPPLMTAKRSCTELDSRYRRTRAHKVKLVATKARNTSAHCAASNSTSALRVDEESRMGASHSAAKPRLSTTHTPI
eukprot:Amastigsp_a846247_16.p5 type:complete len:135 gc:universal Amastigsp_a846247_16:335-739(+)